MRTLSQETIREVLGRAWASCRGLVQSSIGRPASRQLLSDIEHAVICAARRLADDGELADLGIYDDSALAVFKVSARCDIAGTITVSAIPPT